MVKELLQRPFTQEKLISFVLAADSQVIDVDAIFRNHTNQLIDSILGKQANSPLPVTNEEFAHNNVENIEHESVEMTQRD